MRVLGVDGGSAIAGWGVVTLMGNKFVHEDSGAILTNKKDVIEMRLKILYEQMMNLIKVNKPDVLAVESLFFFRNKTTIVPVSQARGVILLAGAMNDLPVFSYSPLQVKQAVTGYGKADKSQVQFMVKRLLGLHEIPKPDDVADALAVAICHLQASQLNKMLLKI
ncbi:crossover junction endodeoxyribonuclease RuvC [Candidatus Dojkabacteria bacterium]|uniref:Crossover junction endodeoxyribonuclease RuvC n=1 Tax=Candidatus Dojkabacteria bacterium TaxID=2099670 RepID=A0A952DUL6_9BACT|nr:crossover junction endodeoxyribonuclease RuvC [Candidatus Dojkabacteria bacterium]